MNISRLQIVPLRKIWPHEAQDFTSWLVENLDFLGEAIGFDLTLVEQEAAAGPFSADILAEDPQGNFAIIENQLEKTDHDHLGKLLTYLSNLEAKTAIWITSEPRPEHETAIHWLNEVIPADTDFYLIKIEAYNIDDSAPAPLLTIVAGPSAEAKQAGLQKKELAERHVLRFKFWEQLLDEAKKKTSLHANVSPSKDNWSTAGSGRSGIHYTYLIRMQDAEVQLPIESSDRDWNKQFFDLFHENKEAIEDRFGSPLEWRRLGEQKASRIVYTIPGNGLSSEEKWPEIHSMMIDAMVRLEKAFKPEIDKVK